MGFGDMDFEVREHFLARRVVNSGSVVKISVSGLAQRYPVKRK